MEKLQSVIDMYKKGQISVYVLEREIANFLGEKSHVKVAVENKNIVSKSYVLYVLPEKLTDGFHVNYVLDDQAIKSFYTTEELAVVLGRIKKRYQKILSRYNQFLGESKECTVSYSYALGFVMSMYLSYSQDFIIAGKKDFLPDVLEYTELMDKFNIEAGTREDMESLEIKGYISDDVSNLIKKYVHECEDKEVKVVDYEFEKPQVNFGQQEILKVCSSSFGIRDHKEIPHDYIPPR